MTATISGTPEWERFKALLTARGLKLRFVAHEAGLTRQQVWAMLNRKYGHPATQGKKDAVAKALGVPVSFIWGDEPQPTEKVAS